MTDMHNNTNWSLRLAFLGLAGIGSALVGNGCSAVLSFQQCQSDADCSAFDGDWVCENNACVPDGTATSDTTTTEGDGDGDTSGDGDGDTGDGDGDATETNPTEGDGDGDTDTMTEGCSLNSECIALHDEDWLCNPQGECMDGITSECLIVQYPEGEDPDNVIWLGSIMPTSPPFDTLVQPIQNATQLAIEDFNKEANLNNGEKLAWIACDSRGSTDLAQVAAQHLVDVGVPAIIGPIFSEAVIDVAENVTVDNDVFLITPTGTNKAITTLADNNLVWRPITSDVYQANALADRMNAVASQTSTTILFKNDAYGNDLAIDAYGALDGALANNTTTYAYNVFADQQDLLDEIGTVLGQVLAQPTPPETVVIVGTSEAAAIILTYLQTAAQINPALIPQKFIVSHGAVPAMIDAVNLAPDEPTKGALYALMEGVAPIIFDEENFNAFNIRYKIKFMDQDAITTSSLSYDSTLVAAFGIAAIPDGDPITGSNIAAQMEKLVDQDATLISFSGGTAFIDTAVNNLTAGNPVNLKGVSGELDFDLSTGEVRTNYLGWTSVPIGGDLNSPTIEPQRIYVLNPGDATDGNWADLP